MKQLQNKQWLVVLSLLVISSIVAMVFSYQLLDLIYGNIEGTGSEQMRASALIGSMVGAWIGVTVSGAVTIVAFGKTRWVFVVQRVLLGLLCVFSLYGLIGFLVKGWQSHLAYYIPGYIVFGIGVVAFLYLQRIPKRQIDDLGFEKIRSKDAV
ncbi:hypothetical protein KS4_04530 [Poriferisphaera corsica]|uniref:Uncharacterized protein n=1 Tax=Poriferisphaera corsica TaxID=2528020 RepID=A0A517YQD5_9BACT|nr:hypothetical protein [Poriferisphaera corsica]QDU32421.1 hypothetical protein KS4_04530 [Poriferisphaera corsica]